ncbi:hypothetical protein B0E53_07090 [Micromonospora sp. MH33]|nr:hypothetical protein B0E53_07090 [Micromonospora sp. MH33]
MRGEWKACDTRSRLVRRPAARRVAATACTASASPERTTLVGPLTAASPTRSVRCGVTSAASASTATIAPPAGSACMSRARAATRAAASASGNTPATWAAASSPIEWPSSRSGRTPQDSSSRYSATSTANSAGWV